MDARDINTSIVGLEKAVSELRTDTKAIFKRIDEQREQSNAIYKTNESVVRMETKLDVILEKLADHEGRISALESKPAKRWETVIGTIIGAAVGALMSLLFKK